MSTKRKRRRRRKVLTKIVFWNTTIQSSQSKRERDDEKFNSFSVLSLSLSRFSDFSWRMMWWGEFFLYTREKKVCRLLFCKKRRRKNIFSVQFYENMKEEKKKTWLLLVRKKKNTHVRTKRLSSFACERKWHKLCKKNEMMEKQKKFSQQSFFSLSDPIEVIHGKQRRRRRPEGID